MLRPNRVIELIGSDAGMILNIHMHIAAIHQAIVQLIILHSIPEAIFTVSRLDDLYSRGEGIAKGSVEVLLFELTFLISNLFIEF